MEKIGENHPHLQKLGMCFVSDGDGLRFIDVLSSKNELFEPNQLPRSIMEDEIVGPGYEEIINLSQAGQLTLHIVGSAHGSENHFREAYQQHLKGLLALPNSKNVGIEVNWHIKEGSDLLVLQNAELDFDRLHPNRGQGFQPIQTATLREKGKTILPFEYGNHEATPISQHINDLFELYNWAIDNPNLNDMERNNICVRASLAWQIYRQKTMLGRAGAWLKTLRGQNQLNEGNNNVIIHIGAGHSPVVSLLNNLGIKAIYYPTEHTDFPGKQKVEQWEGIFKPIMHSSYATNEQLATLTGHP